MHRTRWRWVREVDEGIVEFLRHILFLALSSILLYGMERRYGYALAQ